MTNAERVKVWQERLAQWRASGLSQRAFALKHDIPFRQVGYWARRLPAVPMASAKIDYAGALPIMVPDQQTYRGGVFYQTWRMNTDAPKFTFELLCSYKDIDRQLPVAAPDVSKCVLSTLHDKLLAFQRR